MHIVCTHARVCALVYYFADFRKDFANSWTQSWYLQKNNQGSIQRQAPCGMGQIKETVPIQRTPLGSGRGLLGMGQETRPGWLQTNGRDLSELLQTPFPPLPFWHVELGLWRMAFGEPKLTQVRRTNQPPCDLYGASGLVSCPVPTTPWRSTWTS